MADSDEEVVERGKFRVCVCVVLPFFSFFFLSLSLALSLDRAGPRFKYQRRLKSDLYHAELCYLYRFIRDLLARYSEGGILVQHRVDRGANIVQDKDSHQAPSRGENTSIRGEKEQKGERDVCMYIRVLGPSGEKVPDPACACKPN